MNVAIILDTVPVGGPGKGVIQLANSLRDSNSGVKVTVYNFLYENHGKQFFNNAATSNGLELRTIKQSSRLDWRFLRTLSRQFEEDEIEIVQTHSFKPHVVAKMLQKSGSFAWLAFAHGWTAQSLRVHAYNFLERRLLRKADFCCTVTDDLRDEFIRYGCRRESIRTIPNAVFVPGSVASRLSEDFRSKHGISTKAPVIACIGRFSAEKGQDILIDAIKISSVANLDFHLVFAGDGPEEDRIRELVLRNGLGHKVTFLGFLEDVSVLYSVSDMLVVPSRSEGVPNVVLEAFARGIPVISTPVGAMPGIIGESGAGWLSNDISAESLSDTMFRALRDFSEPGNIGEKGLNYVRSEFDPMIRQKRFLSVYSRMLQAEGQS